MDTQQRTSISSLAWECRRGFEATHHVAFYWTVTLGEITRGSPKGHICSVITLGLGDRRVSLKITRKWRIWRERARFNRVLQKLIDAR